MLDSGSMFPSGIELRKIAGHFPDQCCILSDLTTERGTILLEENISNSRCLYLSRNGMKDFVLNLDRLPVRHRVFTCFGKGKIMAK